MISLAWTFLTFQLRSPGLRCGLPLMVSAEWNGSFLYADGGCLMLTAFFYQGKTRASFIQSATRHDAVVSLS